VGLGQSDRLRRRGNANVADGAGSFEQREADAAGYLALHGVGLDVESLTRGCELLAGAQQAQIGSPTRGDENSPLFDGRPLQRVVRGMEARPGWSRRALRR
jgi:hypothetical protein